MREKGLGWILRELAGDRQAKSSNNVDAMNVDTLVVVPRTATLAPGSTLYLKHTVDLESMAFSQGCWIRSASSLMARSQTSEEGLRGNSRSCAKAKTGH